jgi:hypothetical protein
MKKGVGQTPTSAFHKSSLGGKNVHEKEIVSAMVRLNN